MLDLKRLRSRPGKAGGNPQEVSPRGRVSTGAAVVSGSQRQWLRHRSARDFNALLALALWAGLVSLFSAVTLWWFGRMNPLHGVFLVLPGLLVAIFGAMRHRGMVSHRRGRVLRVVLILLGATQALVWTDLLLRLAPAEPLVQLLILSVLVLSLSVLIYQVSVFLLILLLCGASLFLHAPGHVPGHTSLHASHQALAHTQAWPLLGALSIALVMGLVAWRLLLQKRRAERREYELIQALAHARAQLQDRRARVGSWSDSGIAQAGNAKGPPPGDPADRAAQTKTDFLATISHEIRTPLNGILPILEILLDSSLNEEQRRYVRTAHSSSLHLLRLINDVLDFARAESGKLQLESIDFDFRELVSSVCDLMYRSAINKGLSLELDIGDDIPRKLRGDPIRLRQILTNLLSNALKFTEAGYVRISVARRRARRREVELFFSVRDSGIGMSRDTSRRVFSSFTQADASTTRKHGGTGLGLVICKRLVNLMGGRIGVRSRPGEGSEFWFVLPMRRSLDEVPPGRRDLVGVRLMGVLPDTAGRARVEQLLGRFGIALETATWEEVVTRLHTAAMLGPAQGFDLLLLQPDGDEQAVWELLAELRSDPLLKALPVVLASESEKLLARAQSDFGACALAGGWEAAPLKRCLERLLDVQQAHAAAKSDGTGVALSDLNLVPEDALFEADAPFYPSPVCGDRDVNVLLAEDNPVNLGVVRRVLDRLGVGVRVAQNGREALEQLAAGGIDLVLMDCRMPVMDGYQATRGWRERELLEGRSRLPVVAMTANAMLGDREQCLEAGMDDYLAKPVSVSDIRKMLEKWLPGGLQPGPGETAFATANTEQKAELVVDRKAVTELRELMDQEFDQLVATFLANSPGLLEKIGQAAKQQDLAALIDPAHSLKSSSANLGALKLSAVARGIETASREGRMQAALLGCQRLVDVYAETRSALIAEMQAP